MNRREFLQGVAAAAALMCCPVVGSRPQKLRPMHLIVTWRAGGLSHVRGRDVMIAGEGHLRAIEHYLKAGLRRGFYEDYVMWEFPA